MESVFFEVAKITTDGLNQRCADTLNTALGIEFSEIGLDFLEARMPVDARTIQPRRVLNGGASLALIETVGSMAANLTLNRGTHYAVGQTVQASHFRPVSEGSFVKARATPLHLGKRSQVWEVKISNPGGQLVCSGTITMAVIPVSTHG